MRAAYADEGMTIEPNHPLFSQAVVRLRNAMGADLRDSREVHKCTAQLCKPQSESMLVTKGKLVAPPLTSNVFLCSYGTIHVCSERACEHYGCSQAQTCHISGFQFGSKISDYTRGDPRTWNAKPEPSCAIDTRLLLTQSGPAAVSNGSESKKRLPEPIVAPVPPAKRIFSQKRLSIEDLTGIASGMVKLLLYSRNRINRNKDAIKTFQHDAGEARVTYVRQQLQNQQLPYWTDTYRLIGHYSSQELPLIEFVYSSNLHDYYVNVIVQVWKKVMLYYVPVEEKEYETDGITEIPPRVKFDDVCLGVLYAMRQGIRYNGHVFLPKDDFLLMNLPIGSDLYTYFGIRKNRISKGDKILEQTYNNALAANASLTDIMIDVTILPEKREEQLIQMPGQVAAIITTSGEKLFMPKSRKEKK